jgi:ACS family hexuronate transporter-like MFS transporter
MAVVVITINMTWQFFRAWMPKFLREYHDFDASTVNYFSSVFYLVTGIACVGAGAAVKSLAARGWRIHSARMAVFCICCALAAASTVAALLGNGPLLLVLLLVVGSGSMSLFPIYYAFVQDLSVRNQGIVVGTLSAITWIITAVMHRIVGQTIDATGSYAEAVFSVGLLPAVGAIALWLGWDSGEIRQARAESPAG